MTSFTFNSFKSKQDRELLNTLREAIFILKLEVQRRLYQNGYTEADLMKSKLTLAEFLSNLESTTSFLSKGILEKDLDFAFVGFANRFIKVNPDDVSDRIETIKRVHTKIQNNGTLLERDFQFLDRLQSYLEEEVAQSVQGLFRL